MHSDAPRVFTFPFRIVLAVSGQRSRVSQARKAVAFASRLEGAAFENYQRLMNKENRILTILKLH